MKNSIRGTFCILVLFAASFVQALDFESDSFNLSIVEGQGRFSLSYKHGGDATPLFVAEDLSTTYFKLLLNNRIYALGDSFAFQQTSELTDYGGIITWKSSRISIQAIIDISHTSYANIDVAISNIAEVSQDVGLRLLLDTYLGERGDHFILPDGPIETETEFVQPPEYIQSGDSENETLYLIYDSYGASVPDRIVLANWKRLDEVNWGYTINTNRSFNYSPYSINDSAVSTYFEPVELAPGETLTIRTILATTLPRDIAASLIESTQTPGITSESEAEKQLISDHVVTIDELLNLIDAMLAAERDPTDEELAFLIAAVRSIRERQAHTE